MKLASSGSIIMLSGWDWQKSGSVKLQQYANDTSSTFHIVVLFVPTIILFPLPGLKKILLALFKKPDNTIIHIFSLV